MELRLVNDSARTLLAVLAGIFFLALTGCGGILKQPPVAKGYFAIETSVASENSNSAAPAAHRAGVLRVGTIRVSPPYDAATFVYRLGPTQFDTDYYNNFIAPPASLLTGSLVQWLDTHGPMTVVDSASGLQSKLRLEGNVTDFYIDSSNKAAPIAVVGGRFFLIRQYQNADELGLELPFHETAPVRSRSPADFAAALSQAWQRVLVKLTQALDHEVSQKPSQRAG